jgi:hypothetical protein
MGEQLIQEGLQDVALIGRERVIKKKTREIERKAYEVCP